jgi:hypothetical protein
MSAPETSDFGPYAFSLTADEARIAAARAGLRRALAGGLTAGHFAPLAAFVLAILFVAILALTGLVGRRPAEAALLVCAAAFLVQRLATRRRFFVSRRVADAEIERLRAAGALVLSVEADGLRLDGGPTPQRWRFADCLDAEDAGGLVYLWPRQGAPAIAPTRVFRDQTEAARFARFLRSRLPGRVARAPTDDDDAPATGGEDRCASR